MRESCIRKYAVRNMQTIILYTHPASDNVSRETLPLAPWSRGPSANLRLPRCFSGERERGFSQKSRLSYPGALLFGGYVVQ